jgi:hypothetical protein
MWGSCCGELFVRTAASGCPDVANRLLVSGAIMSGTDAIGFSSAAYDGFPYHAGDCQQRERDSDSRVFRKMHVTKSIAFRPDRGKMKW